MVLKNKFNSITSLLVTSLRLRLVWIFQWTVWSFPAQVCKWTSLPWRESLMNSRKSHLSTANTDKKKRMLSTPTTKTLRETPMTFHHLSYFQVHKSLPVRVGSLLQWWVNTVVSVKLWVNSSKELRPPHSKKSLKLSLLMSVSLVCTLLFLLFTCFSWDSSFKDLSTEHSTSLVEKVLQTSTEELMVPWRITVRNGWNIWLLVSLL